ncbi:CheR family methyltransferase [Spongisporangium articulatum]|uniref:protein-glutamate O-methyltransferase n=1 Tax=Spongisporangium articulatum TaxID=3362603 RepID=A0ABW8AKP5_9ACTN
MNLTQADFSYVAGLVKQRSSIDLQPGKEYLVESRLMPVARNSGESDLASLVARLRRGDEKLTAAVIDAMTTNETSWFRDSHPFEAFTKTLLPQVVQDNRTGPITVWSAACSSGQEGYSLAMLLQEWLPTQPGRTARIIGTDISASMVERARAGRYSQLEINRGLPARYLVKHFEQHGREWQVRESLRSMTRFDVGNLTQPQSGVSSCDVVFLRNVLIYFDLATKRQVIQNVRRSLRPGGFLVLGGAESALSLDDSFRRLEVDKAVVFQHGGAK